MKKVYLCGPIANSSDSECNDWRNYIKNRHGSCLDPMIRDYRGKTIGNEKEIVENDKKDIDECDILLLNYFKPSVGSSMEVFYAFNTSKTVIIVDNSNHQMSPWLVYHSTYIAKSLDESISIIKKLC